MKKVICMLVVFVGFSIVGFSQEQSSVSVTKGNVELMESVRTGDYDFQLPEHLTSEFVAKRAGYYKSFFTVDFVESTSMASVSMLEGKDDGKRVIARFLASCGVRTLKVDDEELSIDQFISTYLK